METERLLTRSFVPDGWHAPRELSMQKEASEYPLHDHQWPTSDEAIRGTTRWFARMDAGGKVSREEMFLPFDDEKMDAYRKEARARWGTTWKKAVLRTPASPASRRTFGRAWPCSCPTP
ncbi:MAG: hypothetical protein HPY83_03115 [Anaerolineae bacterium]|nr:hypothetical protein [Anaerolineae bacterium]